MMSDFVARSARPAPWAIERMDTMCAAVASRQTSCVFWEHRLGHFSSFKRICSKVCEDTRPVTEATMASCCPVKPNSLRRPFPACFASAAALNW